MVIYTYFCVHTTFYWYYTRVTTHVSDNFYILLYMLQTPIITSCNYKFSNIQFQQICTPNYNHKLSVYISPFTYIAL
jgi:hypothetical protein